MSRLDLISYPVKKVEGTFSVPGDKSISHRAIIFGALAQGTTLIEGFLNGEDCMSTLNAFKAMGVTIEKPSETKVLIQGVGKHGLKKPKQSIDCGNSGTSMRLLAGLLAAQSFDSELIGDESLTNRPMLRISEPLKQMGAKITTREGKPPLRIQGNNPLKGIEYHLPQASAQVKSCLLLAGMYAQGSTKIIEKEPSRDHSELMLQTLSYPLKKTGSELEINGEHEAVGATIQIPGDISSAAFFIVAATIIPGSKLKILNVGINPTRTGIIHILTQMGANIEIENKRLWGKEWVADIEISHAPLKGIDIPENMIPLAIDEFPIIFIAAACAEGQTRLTGAKELRLKESDRISVMVQGLSKLGVYAQELEEGLIIEGGPMKGGEIDSQGDHRIAMAFTVAGAVCSEPLTIKNCDNIATSFPNFLTTANKVHFKIEENINNV